MFGCNGCCDQANREQEEIKFPLRDNMRLARPKVIVQSVVELSKEHDESKNESRLSKYRGITNNNAVSRVESSLRQLDENAYG